MAWKTPVDVVEVQSAEEYFDTVLTRPGLDIARAAGIASPPPSSPLVDALRLATSLAVHRGNGAMVLRALTGRGSVDSGFTVLG